jgi:hypothetical protein
MELDYILGHSKETTWKTFSKNVDLEDLKGLESQLGVSLATEQFASFFKSITFNKKVTYYLQMSGIEYIFY